jgi:hypothetical protein
MPSPWFRLRALLLLVGAFFGLAPTLSGSRPTTTERVVLDSTTDFVVYTAPTWARSCLIKNAHGSATMYLGRYGETGAFNATTSEYITIPSGAAVTRCLSAGVSAAPADHLTMPIASAQASHPAEFECSEAPCS